MRQGNHDAKKKHAACRFSKFIVSGLSNGKVETIKFELYSTVLNSKEKSQFEEIELKFELGLALPVAQCIDSLLPLRFSDIIKANLGSKDVFIAIDPKEQRSFVYIIRHNERFNPK